MGKIAIFVDYAHFYVNIIMSTEDTMVRCCFIILNYLTRYSLRAATAAQNVVFASFPALRTQRVRIIYPSSIFVQLNHSDFFVLCILSFCFVHFAVIRSQFPMQLSALMRVSALYAVRQTPSHLLPQARQYILSSIRLYSSTFLPFPAARSMR